MSRTTRTREEAARELGMRLREVISVTGRATDDVVTTHDGVRTVMGDDGSLTFYPAGKTAPLPYSRGPRPAEAPEDPLPPAAAPVTEAMALPPAGTQPPSVDNPAPADDKTTEDLPPGGDDTNLAAGDEVPAGPTDLVLDWVGDDRARAQRALDAEKAAASPRKGVTVALEKLLADTED